jgi:hypothetical protein
MYRIIYIVGVMSSLSFSWAFSASGSFTSAWTDSAMTDEAQMNFGTVQVAKADIGDYQMRLHLNLLDGVSNKCELGVLIEFLRAKQARLDTLDIGPAAT